MPHPRKLTKKNKLKIATRQDFTCANKPGSNLVGLYDYECPRWKESECCGKFDVAGYHIDHIIPHCLSQDDHESNLQALCVACHAAKTNMTPLWIETSIKGDSSSNITENHNNNKNNNNTIVNNYNIVPFGTDGIDCLTMEDKVSIFTSVVNPMEMIISKVNLDPTKKEHHNVGYIDNHFEDGITYNGKEWITDQIDYIIHSLCETKLKDLQKIYNEIKICLLAEFNEEIKIILNNILKSIKSSNQEEVQSRHLLYGQIKSLLYNSRNLTIEARNHTNNNNNNDCDKPKINFKGFLKHSVTIENMADIINNEKQKKKLLKFIQTTKN